MNEENKYPSRDLTYEWGRTAPEELSKVADALDTKILVVFSVACIVISVITALANKIQLGMSLIPLIVAFISFIVIFIKSLRVIKPQKFYVADSPRILREDFWKLEPEDAKAKYWGHLEKDFQENYDKVEAKGRTLKCTVVLLFIETMALIGWLVCLLF
jgi:hypothetical protein